MNLLSLPPEMLSNVLKHTDLPSRTQLRWQNSACDRIARRSRLNMFCVGELRIHLKSLDPGSSFLNMGICVSDVKISSSQKDDRRRTFRNIQYSDILDIFHSHMKVMKEIKGVVLSGDSNGLLSQLLHCFVSYKIKITEIHLENWAFEGFNCESLRRFLYLFKPTGFHIDRCMGLDTLQFDEIFGDYIPCDVSLSSRRLEVLEHLTMDSLVTWGMYQTKRINFHIHGITIFDSEEITKFLETFLPGRSNVFWQFGYIPMRARSKAAWVRNLKAIPALAGYEIHPDPLSNMEEFEHIWGKDCRPLTIHKFDKNVHNFIVIHFVD